MSLCFNKQCLIVKTPCHKWTFFFTNIYIYQQQMWTIYNAEEVVRTQVNILILNLWPSDELIDLTYIFKYHKL